MMTDKQATFSAAQAITASAASTNTYFAGPFYGARTKIALKPPHNDIGVVLHVDTLFDSAGGAGTLTPKWQTDDNASFSSATDLFTLPCGTIAEAALTAGAIFGPYNLPPGEIFEEYNRLYYTVAGENFTAGKLNAFMVMDITKWTPFNVAYTID